MKLENRFWCKVDRRGPDECWPWMAAVRKKGEGYGAFWLNGRHQPAPRVAYELANVVSVPAGMVVCHRCDNPSCCNPAHLFVGSPQDNDADRVAKGRQALGSRNAASKLTERQAWAIRRMWAMGVSAHWLAEWFGVTMLHVVDIARQRRGAWRHIDNAAMAKQAREEWEARRARR